MARGALIVNFILVDDRNRVNSQIGVSNVLDHQLARLPDAVMSHIVAGLSPEESLTVYVNPLPIFSRIIPDKNEVRYPALFRAVNTYVAADSIAKKLAFTIVQRKLTSGMDHSHLLIRGPQCVCRIRDAAGLAGDQLPMFVTHRWRRGVTDRRMPSSCSRLTAGSRGFLTASGRVTCRCGFFISAFVQVPPESAAAYQQK